VRFETKQASCVDSKRPAFMVERPTGCRIKCGMTVFVDGVGLNCFCGVIAVLCPHPTLSQGERAIFYDARMRFLDACTDMTVGFIKKYFSSLPITTTRTRPFSFLLAIIF